MIGCALIQIGQIYHARRISRHGLRDAGMLVGYRKYHAFQCRRSKLIRDIQNDLGLFGVDLMQFWIFTVLLFYFHIQILLHGRVVVRG